MIWSLLVAPLCMVGMQASPIPIEVRRFDAPSLDTAAERGPQIFNSVFDSLRNYGSNLHPNGMSFIVATIPEGVLLHHGSLKNSTPTTFDWLAFEIEHAEVFTRPFRRRPPKRGKTPHGAEVEDQSLFGIREEEEHGWLHTYRTVEPLRLLYLDGMSGNKDGTGVIDTQDYILRAVSLGEEPRHLPSMTRTADGELPPLPRDEYARVRDICKLCAEWNLHGALRTETPGSEVIKCDFADGLEEVQSLQREDPKDELLAGHGGPGRDRGEKPGAGIPYDFESGFRDLGAGRVFLDYSTMVSAFAFPINLTNPDTDPIERDLPRLVEATPEQRLAIKKYVAQIVGGKHMSQPQSGPRDNWRDVTDLIVRRYARPLASIADPSQTTSVIGLLESIRFLVNVFLDYSVDDPGARERLARERCSEFYLQTKQVSTESDQMIHAAVKSTSERICSTLFDNEALLRRDANEPQTLVDEVKQSFQGLIHDLDWSVFENKYKQP